jgi:hypothetical protein
MWLFGCSFRNKQTDDDMAGLLHIRDRATGIQQLGLVLLAFDHCVTISVPLYSPRAARFESPETLLGHR